MAPTPKLRFYSWGVAASSVLAPGALLVHQLAEFEEWAKAQEGHVCGMPVLAMWVFAVIVCVTLSLVAATLNGIHLRRSRPVAPKRYAELAAVASPAIAAFVFVLAALASL